MVVSNIFHVHPSLGQSSPFDEHIFGNGLKPPTISRSPYPKRSMYGMCTYIYHKHQPFMLGKYPPLSIWVCCQACLWVWLVHLAVLLLLADFARANGPATSGWRAASSRCGGWFRFQSCVFLCLVAMFASPSRNISGGRLGRGLGLHPQKLTWNLKLPPWKRRNIYKPPIFAFHVSL